ncbi:peptide/nickel transport system permease protein [Cytobacillus horneckiae]|uniref:ABC transporter permease n=1 Tax=Cytobacillus horneckiae TaxID=549687 RepID=A0A2N0ZDM8_9BACI|nr:ABC transporter permease [Cytobacillus horneckiae]NRG44345.1 ABC transporter permease [Bacillus sp. CRN 9]MBN6884966.1 ABC transporter permease [Cytobacillus horneckiae]MCM3179288.1 ABC transporter permease [Cytobacillus horneckiae]MEC1154510.1 ABC transporter permease [Cytobacillus horneckiae]MED2937845.1 ABC transporter permease [Cytobacillus horneckiae]
MAETVTVTGNERPKKKKKEHEFILTAKKLLKNKLAVIGLIIIILQVGMAIFAPMMTSHDPVKQNLAASELPIFSEGHWLGTDNYGRDVWSRIVFGSRISLVVGIVAVSLGLLGGVTLGLLGGYYKKLDGIIMRIVDLLFSFPGILLAMLIIAVLGTSLINVAIAISIWSIPACARIVRGSVLSIKEKEYIMAMKSVGASDLRIMFKHILPNCFAPIIVFATMRMATAILSTAALSYLGLGAQPPTPEWGAMISQGQAFMWSSPHLTIIPGIAIMLTVFAFNVVGDGLRDAIDPNMDV